MISSDRNGSGSPGNEPVEQGLIPWASRSGSVRLWLVDLDDGAGERFERRLASDPGVACRSGSCVAFFGSDPAQARTAMRLGGLHFLLKPIADDELGVAVARALEHAWVAELRARSEALSALLQERDTGASSDASPVVLSSRTRSHRIDRRLVRFAEARNKQTLIETDRGSIEVHLPFARVVDALGPKMFVRTHRSCLVAVERIVSLVSTGRGAWFVSLDCGRRIPVSRIRLKDLRARLGEGEVQTGSPASAPLREGRSGHRA